MSTLTPNRQPPAPLSENARNALLTLLGDEDPEVYKSIRATILTHGPVVVDWLRPHTISREPVLRRRALDIIAHFERQNTDNCFLGFCVSHGEDLDLEKGVWLLARTRYPDLNIAAYEAMLDSFAAENPALPAYPSFAMSMPGLRTPFPAEERGEFGKGAGG